MRPVPDLSGAALRRIVSCNCRVLGRIERAYPALRWTARVERMRDGAVGVMTVWVERGEWSQRFEAEVQKGAA